MGIGNWEREMFIESSSFAASAATGIGVVNAGGAALMLLMVATPVGWISCWWSSGGRYCSCGLYYR